MAKLWNSFWGAENEPDAVRKIDKTHLYVLLERDQIGLRSIVAMQMVLLVLWSIGTIVPGFGFYDGQVGVFNAISHTGFWLSWEIFLLFLGGATLSFAITASLMQTTKKDLHERIEQLRRSYVWIIFWVIVLIIAIAANITHIVACGVELSYCSSTLCMDTSGFLIAFIVLLSLVIVVEVTAFVYACLFRRDLRLLRLFLEKTK